MPLTTPRRRHSFRLALGLLATLTLSPGCSAAPPPLSAADQQVVDAKDAWRARDRSRLQSARNALQQANHPLAMWAAYWELNGRLNEASPGEVDAFLARWSGSYIEDRLRNDWLLELGRRKDWPRLIQAYAAYRMRDDREAACWWQQARLRQGEKVAAEAIDTWEEQRETDTGCQSLAQALREANQLPDRAVWRRLREAAETGRGKLALQYAGLLGNEVARQVDEAFDNPGRLLKKRQTAAGAAATGVIAVALVRMAVSDSDAAARLMNERWERRLPAETAGWAWAGIARQAALRLDPQAPGYYERAWTRLNEQAHPAQTDELEHFDNPADRAVELRRRGAPWSDETLAWQARAALRAATDQSAAVQTREHRWRQVLQALETMSPAAQADPTWIYWRARTLLALPAEAASPADLAAPGVPALAAVAPAAPASPAASVANDVAAASAASQPASDLARAATRTRPSTHQLAQRMLAGIAGPQSFYAQLAAEEIAQPEALPPLPAPVTAQERSEIRSQPGLSRAVQLMGLGLRGEGVREWNYTVAQGRSDSLGERQLLAAAQWACEMEIWDRCIHTSERIKQGGTPAHRYPTPFRREVLDAARAARIDPAYVYGLIRQESRFIIQARSGVGASGLMQLMPATAQWTARKLGISHDPADLHDPAANIKLGVTYLKLALDNFGGSQALAAAAYNAGPGRPRRWRDGATVDAAAWVEGIPFSETRDYVKKVLANSNSYAALLGRPGTLRSRLGSLIGPRTPDGTTPNPDLP